MDGDIGPWVLDPLTERELEILRHISAGMSDREIAQGLFLSLNTVKWHNRQIYSKLSVGSRRQAVARAREEGLLDALPDAAIVSSAPPRHNLPVQITSFVGRDREITDVKQLLFDVHLLTLTGPPGTGKTRLALRAVAEFADTDDFGDGVYFVDLAPISQPELVADTIAGALGVKQIPGQPITETLKNYLRTRKLLLLLDNFEQIIDAAPLVMDLLATAPDLKVLVTSREALQVYGEQEYPVPPLTLPDLSRPEPLPELMQYEAVALFVHRAQVSKPDFEMTDDDAAAVAEICVRLDGLPLAIELAAARLKLFSPQVLLGQLESRFTALRGGLRDLPPRQQTLRGAIAWSYELLDGAEKTLFARLSVFQGGRSIDAVDKVCSHDLPIDVLDGLESLMNKSLLRHEAGAEGGPRFVMLETIHEYGREALDQMGETADMRRRHAAYFLELAEQGDEALRGPNQNLWIGRLESELDNLRVALGWSLDGADPALGLQLAGALGRFWYQIGQPMEGSSWLERALEAAPGVSPAVRARALNGIVTILIFKGEAGHPHVKAWSDEAVALFRELGDRPREAWALVNQAGVLWATGEDIDDAERITSEALELARNIDDSDSTAYVLIFLGEIARLKQDYENAREFHEESLAIYRQLGNRFLTAVQLWNVGFCYLHAGYREQAAASFEESLTLALEQGLLGFAGFLVGGIASVAAENGELERAARLFGAFHARMEAIGMEIQSQDEAGIEPYVSVTKRKLGAKTFETLLEEGRAMTEEQAVAYAFSQDSK
jgi:predicted ATPase/DNA-binding CsgD family transcriptional regulator